MIRSIRTRDATAIVHWRLFMVAPRLLALIARSIGSREPRCLEAGSSAGSSGALESQTRRLACQSRTCSRAVGELAHIADIASFPPVFSYRPHNRQSCPEFVFGPQCRTAQTKQVSTDPECGRRTTMISSANTPGNPRGANAVPSRA